MNGIEYKTVVWKCVACQSPPCILIVKDGDGKPSKCPYGLTIAFEDDPLKWQEGSIEDLNIKVTL